MTALQEAIQTTILIVDDTPENLTVLSEVLHPTWRVRAANSGRRALQIAQGEPQPDLILLDVMMPEMDGHEVISQLKADPRTQEIPVIFVTAMDGTEDEERGLDLGAVDYITKPLRPAIVRARVRTHLELRRAKAHLKNENQYLEDEVARRMRQNQIIQEVSIRALARLAETRDPETGNHLRRTQAYVQTLADALIDNPRFSAYLEPHTVQLLVRSAPLHDIGKVGLPDHVLLKPGKLTAEEWAIMQTHSRLGHDAIEQAEQDAEESVEFLAIAKEIAYYHHEKWDGSGYPKGLAGDAIPISARLMALADVFDALICRRVYKPPMPIDKARQIIEEGRGTHFDPDVVDAFVLKFSSFTDIAQRYSDEEML
ncbi:MAG: two-component system response regulator [Zoogloeaceae bacterium]|nr:two-component system response regulator [Zoogloeaceae bacterium]